MRFVEIMFLLLIVVVAVDAGKITWSDNGHPIMSETDRPIEGCSERGFESLGEDTNSSTDCTHK